MEFSTGSKSRGCSVAALPLGGLLVLGSIYLLQWNEGRAVRTALGLGEAAAVMISVEAGEASPANEGKLVHVSGDTATEAVLADEKFNISANAIQLRRVVEMYQWREDKREEKEGDRKRTYYTYDQVWSDRPIDSSRFNDTSKANPRFPFDSESWAADAVELGAFELSESQIRRIDAWKPLELDETHWRKLPAELQQTAKLHEGKYYIPVAKIVQPPEPENGEPPASGDPTSGENSEPPATGDPPSGDPPSGDPTGAGGAGDPPSGDPPSGEPAAGDPPATREELDERLQRDLQTDLQGDPPVPQHTDAEPRLGDVRVRFEVVYPTKVSLLAVQKGDSFIPFATQSGTQVDVLRVGEFTKEQLIDQEKAANTMLTWILRGVGWFLSFIGMLMFLAPVAKMAEYIPLLGKIVGTGVLILGFGLSVAAALITIAIAWVAYRPVLAISLLVVAVLAIVLIVWLLRSRNAAAKG